MSVAKDFGGSETVAAVVDPEIAGHLNCRKTYVAIAVTLISTLLSAYMTGPAYPNPAP